MRDGKHRRGVIAVFSRSSVKGVSKGGVAIFDLKFSARIGKKTVREKIFRSVEELLKVLAKASMFNKTVVFH